MPSVNPSVVLRKKHDIVYEDRPVPKLQDPHFVRIAIKKTGICGSDVHYVQHGETGPFVVKSPMVLGHESSGVIVEVGSAVTNVKVGDRVAVEPGYPSRYSKETMRGLYNLCPHMAFAATPPYDGTLARYFTVPEDFVYPLPDTVSFEDGALCEPLAVAVHANKLGNTTFGSSVYVFGAGPIGLLITATAKAYGATDILVIDLFDDKLEMAKKLGATAVYNSSNDKGVAPAEIVKKLHQTYFVPQVVLEATGAPPCIQVGVAATGNAGTYVQVGMSGNEVNGFPIGAIGVTEAVVKGSFRYNFGDYEDAVKLLANGKVDGSLLITHRFTFKEAIKAYDFAATGKAIKIMIDGPTDED
ncbi:L-iditol 2-dehydrogenase [Saccharomycopsis crataegensis]|uniref:L-iditol 2-dehydrogenase n=1 Tax=Saccharomycopsis crataegensis TaxID=43959 RepID=A0AAV5QMF9_9ASCO|nr:L-iditol 2-dehydrogenase [Saccharomycopsis crataegensis]